jgi:hypothetical protein
MLDHANGEISPDRPADLPPVWDRINDGKSVSMGGAHVDGCPNGSGDDTDCGCATRTFDTSACQGCGDVHHGERHQFTLWRNAS